MLKTLLFTLLGIFSTVFSLLIQWNEVDKVDMWVRDGFMSLESANKTLIHHGNTVALPFVIFALVCFAIVIVDMKNQK
ncbi:hypothetical protein F4X90_20385 [Candidatus Poribacteria bacterium]|nr:hypothetical protein [Candidatus Poribacteria bacterium]